MLRRKCNDLGRGFGVVLLEKKLEDAAGRKADFEQHAAYMYLNIHICCINIYIHVYIYVYMCVYVYMYIYIYM